MTYTAHHNTAQHICHISHISHIFSISASLLLVQSTLLRHLYTYSVPDVLRTCRIAPPSRWTDSADLSECECECVTDIVGVARIHML